MLLYMTLFYTGVVNSAHSNDAGVSGNCGTTSHTITIREDRPVDVLWPDTAWGATLLHLLLGQNKIKNI